MDTNAVIGLRIKNLRNEKKYTLKYVSENTGLSIGFLSQLERGMTSIAIDFWIRLQPFRRGAFFLF